MTRTLVGVRRLAGLTTIRAIGALTAGEVVNRTARFGAMLVLARELSLEDFGRFNVAIAVAGLLIMASGLGLPETGAREVSVMPDRAQPLADRVLGGRLIAVALLGSMTLATAAVAAPDELTILALSVVMAMSAGWCMDWLLRGLGRMRAVAVAFSVGGVAVLLGVLALVAAESDAETALAVFVAGDVIVAALSIRSATLGRLPRPSFRGLRAVLRRSWPLGASA